MQRINYGISLDRLIEGLYKADLRNEARQLYLLETAKVQRNLDAANKMSEEQMYSYAEQVLMDVTDYKKLLRIIDKHEDSIFFNKEKAIFDQKLDRLEAFFMPEEEQNAITPSDSTKSGL